MSSLLKRISKVDTKTKYGIYGWIRRAEQELQLIHIPMLISSICILFYHEEEFFDIVSKKVKKSIDGKCITTMKSSKHNSNYGITEIASNTDFKL